MKKEAILSFLSMEYGKDGILRLKVVEGAMIDLREAKLQIETTKRLVDQFPYAALVDARAGFNATKAAQEYYAQHSSDRIATAVITTNPVTRILTNTYVSVFKPERPVKQFANETDAIEWLKEKISEFQLKRN